jgi:hypothetical protein
MLVRITRFTAMRVLIWPFFGQQDKRTNKFLLRTCGDMQISKFFSEQLTKAGHRTVIIVPESSQTDDLYPFNSDPFPIRIHPNNMLQRLDFCLESIDVVKKFDLLIAHHETIAIAARHVDPKLKIISHCLANPGAEPWPKMRPLFECAWECSDLTAFQNSICSQYATNDATAVWPFAYDDRDFDDRHPERDIDILFLMRASATNYTHHIEFMEAIEGTKLKVMYADTTNYMAQNGLVPEDQIFKKQSQQDWFDLLYRSKIFVSLRADPYGGLSVRQALRAGSFPLVLRTAAYRELLGQDWPWFIPSLAPSTIRSTIDKVFEGGLWRDVPSDKIRNRVDRESYQAGWRIAKRDIKELMS